MGRRHEAVGELRALHAVEESGAHGGDKVRRAQVRWRRDNARVILEQAERVSKFRQQASQGWSEKNFVAPFPDAERRALEAKKITIKLMLLYRQALYQARDFA